MQAATIASDMFPGNEWLFPTIVFGGIFSFLALLWFVSGGVDQ